MKRIAEYWIEFRVARLKIQPDIFAQLAPGFEVVFYAGVMAALTELKATDDDVWTARMAEIEDEIDIFLQSAARQIKKLQEQQQS